MKQGRNNHQTAILARERSSVHGDSRAGFALLPAETSPQRRRGGVPGVYGGLFPPGLGEGACPTMPSRLRPRRTTIGQYCLLWGWGLCVRIIHTSPSQVTKPFVGTTPAGRRQQHYNPPVLDSTQSPHMTLGRTKQPTSKSTISLSFDPHSTYSK